MSSFLQIVTATVTNTTNVAMTPSTVGRTLFVTIAFVIAALAAIIILGTIHPACGTDSQEDGRFESRSEFCEEWVALLMILAAAAEVTAIAGKSSAFTKLTLSGTGGLAVTLALQTNLSNMIAGVLMLSDGVLRIGDEIEFGTTRGEVVKLNMRTTWVKTAEGVIAVIGNSNLSAGPILNRTAGARLDKKLQD